MPKPLTHNYNHLHVLNLNPKPFRYRPHLAHQRYNWQTDSRLLCIRRRLVLPYWPVSCDGGVGDGDDDDDDVDDDDDDEDAYEQRAASEQL